MEPKGSELIVDIAKRMNRIMRTFPALKGIVPITGETFEKMDDKDFRILWYMPVTLVAEKGVLREMNKRAEALGLKGSRKIITPYDKIRSN